MQATKKLSPTLLSTWKNVCLDFMRAYQDHKIDKMMSLCDSDATVQFKPLGGDGKGTVHGFGKALWSALLLAFPDLDNTVHNVSMDEGKVRCQVSIRGTQKRPFAGIASKGNSFDSGHIFVFTLTRDHKIDHISIQWDHEDFVRQLVN